MTPEEHKSNRQARADELYQLKGRKVALSDEKFVELWKYIRDEATIRRAEIALTAAENHAKGERPKKGDNSGMCATENSVKNALEILEKHYRVIQSDVGKIMDNDDTTIGYEMALPVPDKEAKIEA